MSKKIDAVNPRTGQWESAEQLDTPHKTGYGRNVETVVNVRFEDGQEVEQPTWATDKKK